MHATLMTALKEHSAVLNPHPESSCPAVNSIRAVVRWNRGRALTVVYRVSGAIERLRIPSAQASGKADELWEHTCFELFIGAQNDAEYYEFNFSPSGQWATYEFRGYREGNPIQLDGMEAHVSLERSADSLELSANIRLDRLPGFQPYVSLCLGLSAVIEDLDGSLSYWALRHPPGKPDFHHADNFALKIEPAAVAGPVSDSPAEP